MPTKAELEKQLAEMKSELDDKQSNIDSLQAVIKARETEVLTDKRVKMLVDVGMDMDKAIETTDAYSSILDAEFSLIVELHRNKNKKVDDQDTIAKAEKELHDMVGPDFYTEKRPVRMLGPNGQLLPI